VRRASAGFLLCLLCLLVYNANLRCIGAGDTLPARFLPLGIWRHGTLELGPIARLVAHGPVSEFVPGSVLQTARTDYTILGSVADDVTIHMA